MLKQLEKLGKTLLAMLVAVLGWRPFRASRARARLASLRGGAVLLVRPDNRVGEALLTTPLIDALAAKGFEVHVLVHPKVRRVLERHPSITRLWSDERRLALIPALRRERFVVVINCGNWEVASVTSAVLSRLCAPHGVVLGPGNRPSRWLMDVPVAARSDTRSEALQRAHFASPLVGELARAPLSFRATAAATFPKPYAVINPGGRLGYRRVAPELFSAAARAASAQGLTPLITWGPGEEALARVVVDAAPGSVLAPPTSLDELASVMRGAQFAVCNNTGPMHLAVAVGCPTLGLFLHMELERWGHSTAPHQMLDLTPLTDPARLAAVERGVAALGAPERAGAC